MSTKSDSDKPAGAGKGGAAKAEGARARRTPAVASVDDLMAYAYAMEAEAAERYVEFADVMEAHNNAEVAELFRKMARIEHLHAQQLRDAMGWTAVPRPSDGRYHWEGLEAPETADHADLHYLMTPYHALKIARLNEERARRFYERLAKSAASAAVREAAAGMRDEEAEHVKLMDEWIARTPVPETGWAVDLDPPNYHD